MTHKNVILMAKELNQIGHRHTWEVFSDFVEIAALSFSNSLPLIGGCEKREMRYLEIVDRYKRPHLDCFVRALSLLVDAMGDDMADHLGALFHHLELHNKYKGQFFTPDVISRLMASLTLTDDVLSRIEEKGFVTVSEPACGSGSTLIALMKSLHQDHGVNYQQCVHVTAVDLDIRCVHMIYTQLSLLHVPAVIVHGNTLTLEEYSHWATPAHWLGLWDTRLRRSKGRGGMEPKHQPIQAIEETQLSFF